MDRKSYLNYKVQKLKIPYKNSSVTYTATHAPMETRKRFPSTHERKSAAAKPARPERTSEVALKIAGKVITDRLT